MSVQFKTECVTNLNTSQRVGAEHCHKSTHSTSSLQDVHCFEFSSKQLTRSASRKMQAISMSSESSFAGAKESMAGFGSAMQNTLSSFTFTCLPGSGNQDVRPAPGDDRHQSSAISAFRSHKITQTSFDVAICDPQSNKDAQNPTCEESVDGAYGQDIRSRNIYSTVSRDIVQEMCNHFEIYANKEIRVIDHDYATYRVASIIANFVRVNSAGVKLRGTADEALKTAINLQKTIALRDKTKNLSFMSPDLYSQILPTDIVDRIGDVVETCVATTTSTKKRCSGKNIDIPRTRQLLQDLADLGTPCEFSDVAQLLASIIESSKCTQHKHQRNAIARLRKLCQHFVLSISDAEIETRREEIKQLQQWIADLIKPLKSGIVRLNEEDERIGVAVEDDPLHHDPDATLVANTDQGLHTESIIVSFKQKSFSLATSGGLNAWFSDVKVSFELYDDWKPAHKRLTPEELVEDIVKTPLTSGDIGRKGRIYVYSRSGNAQWMKIGCTEGNIETRTLGWTAKCGYWADEEPIDHVTGDSPALEVKHPLRLEKLIHAELKHQRHTLLSCSGCGGNHNEWFYVSAVKAKEVVKKWTMWMQTCNPYDELGYFISNTEVKLPSVNGHEARVIVKCGRGAKVVPFSEPRRSSRLRKKAGKA